MCGTLNDQTAQSCSFCGYLFENFGTGASGSSSDLLTANSSLSTSGELNTVPDVQNSSSNTTSSTSPGGSPVFAVGKSLLGTIVPSLVYLVAIIALGSFSGFSLYSLVLVLFFLIVAVVPALTTPRRFEFYDDSLKVHKTIGGDSEYPYSEVTMLDFPSRRGTQQIALSVTGQRRPLIIGKNPTNEQLGMDLKQFLNSKLKKPGLSTEKPASPENEDDNYPGGNSSGPSV